MTTAEAYWMRAPTLLALMPLALAILAAAPPGDDAPQPLAAAIPSGPAKDAVTRLLKPYAQATATELGTPTWDASLDGLKALFAAHDAELALVDGPTLAAGCKAQVFEKLNWAGLGRDRFLAEAASDCGAGAYVSTTILAWDNQKLQGTPGWVDFWDVTKHPGRRGLYKGARGNLEIALLADGVAAADVYRTLRTSEGVDRAFRKLDQLKPYIVWWDQPSQPAQLLASAKVLMTTAPAASLATNASPADAAPSRTPRRRRPAMSGCNGSAA
jgi:putative spermidine/putrescine transport system substrate-binding protein